MKKITEIKAVKGFLSAFKTAKDSVKKQISEVIKAFSVVLGPEPYLMKDRKVNRYLILTLGAVFVLDYFMFCYHSEKNVFSFFPELPVISKQKEVTVYLPALDGQSLLEEKRMAASYESRERFIKFLFNAVVKGSKFQNTALAVPVQMNIRKIWVLDKSGDHEGKGFCAIDCEVPVSDQEVKPIPGSEPLFKKALEQTITANIPEIAGIILLERGVPDKKLW